MIIHLVLNGASESAIGVGIDIIGSGARVLQNGQRAGNHPSSTLHQQVLSIGGLPVTSGAGRAISIDGAFAPEQLNRGDVIILPGWFAVTSEQLEALLHSAEALQAIELLQQAAANGCLITASCSGTFLLAEAGLLQGQSATTAWWLAGTFAQRFPDIRLDAERMVVEADGVLTAGSAFAHADLVLAVLSRITSPSVARWVTRYLVLDQRASQSHYMVLEHLRLSDPALNKAERFIRDNLNRQISLNELASAATMSPRTLSRRIHAALGMTPNEWMQRLRVAHASHLLQTSQASVEKIAELVGYADPAAFRRVYKRFAGSAPSASRPSLTQH